MSSRTIAERELYEQLLDEGTDPWMADTLAREWAESAGEYPDPAGQQGESK